MTEVGGCRHSSTVTVRIPRPSKLVEEEDPLSSTPMTTSHSYLPLGSEFGWDSVSNTSMAIPAHIAPTLPKSSEELRKEIAALESHITHLERYLLSLYRTAFHESSQPVPDVILAPKSPSLTTTTRLYSNKQVQRTLFLPHCSPLYGGANSDPQSSPASFQSSSMRERKKADARCRSLADHLGASILLDNIDTPAALSEDMIRCISSIYCRLSNPLQSYLGTSPSPTSSLSSSSLFSSQNPYDNYSSRCSEDTNKVNCQKLQSFKDESGPYAEMVEVLKIYLDGDSINFASEMLTHFRSLVRNLEKVDIAKMRREEKLAFWINIHNSLVMHAYLAYGAESRARNVLFSKASYNIGGHCINPHVIQNSILGIRSQCSERWLQTLFSPGRKSKGGSSRHVYALEYPEPLVHFALCSGTYSDPAVRVYSAKNIFEELKLAREQFIQASVYIHKEAKILLPKTLSYFAKDMSMDMGGLLEVISDCVTEVQRTAIRKCLGRKGADRCIQWLAQSSSFRYVIHGGLAKKRL